MVNGSLSAAAKKRRGKQYPEWMYLGYPGEEFRVAPKAEDLGTAPAEMVTPTIRPPAKPKADWRGALGAALSGAAHGIQADVGPAVRGQEWAQGLLKGVVGTGIAAAAAARERAARALKAETLSEKIELLAERERLLQERKGKEPSWEEKLGKSTAAKIELIKAASVEKKESDEIKSGLTEREMTDINLKVMELVRKRFPWRNPTEREYWDSFRELKTAAQSRRGLPPEPKEKVPPVPE